MPKEGSKDKDRVWLEPFLKSVKSGGFVAGIRIPSLWVEGIHYVCSDKNQFEEGEPVIVNRSDGSRSVGTVSGDKQKSGEWLKFDLSGPNLRIDVGEGLHKTVALMQVGKIHQSLLECILANGEGAEEDTILEKIEFERKKFMAHYGHLRNQQVLHHSSKSFKIKKASKDT